jgi:hypothetical protein
MGAYLEPLTHRALNPPQPTLAAQSRRSASVAKRAATVLRSDKALEIHDRHDTGDPPRSG